MKVIYVTLLAALAALVLFFGSLYNGSLLRYLDTHPNPERNPKLQYYIGQGFYVMGNLENAATYYYRIAEQYPQSPYAAGAYFNYLQTLDDMQTPRAQMIELYRTYLERFPEGEHAEIVSKRMENYSNSR